jgi:hypothetical protein
MKQTQSSGTCPDHPKVAGTFELKSNGKAIAIGFTDLRLPPCGSALFRVWLRPLDGCRSLAAVAGVIVRSHQYFLTGVGKSVGYELHELARMRAHCRLVVNRPPRGFSGIHWLAWFYSRQPCWPAAGRKMAAMVEVI